MLTKLLDFVTGRPRVKSRIPVRHELPVQATAPGCPECHHGMFLPVDGQRGLRQCCKCGLLSWPCPVELHIDEPEELVRPSWFDRRMVRRPGGFDVI